MNYYTYEELKTNAQKCLKAINPQANINIKTIGIYLQKCGYKKIRKQIDNKRKVYYYLPDYNNTDEMQSSIKNS